MKVLFQIVTLDMSVEIDGVSHVIPGGHVFNVVGVVEGQVYVTDVEYKPGVPQLISWSMAKKIEVKS
jgi:hypothetical protein